MNPDRFPYRLIILRHGQSEWNAAGIFTGWGVLLVYALGSDLRPGALGGQYLDSRAARDESGAITDRHLTDPEEVRHEEQARR